MECFFGAYPRRLNGHERTKMLVCFSIPDAGISFKAPFSGEELHSEYASLLTLLEFIELNGKLFKDRKLNIYGTNLEVVNQVNLKTVCRYEFSDLLKRALEYKDKYGFRLGWVPKESNPATRSLFD